MTLYFNYNYGAVLQAYSLQNVVRGIGDENGMEIPLGKHQFEVKHIRYQRHIDYSISAQPENRSIKKRIISLLCGGIIKKIFFGIRDFYQSKYDAERKRNFDTFISQYIEEFPVPQNGNIAALNNDFDIFLCGSDNIWNRNLFDGRFMLDFVNDDKKKIAYAPGMSTDYLTPTQEKVYKRNAQRFDALSCREKSGAMVLQKLLGKDVFVALDPTLLLSSEDWTKVEKCPIHVNLPDKYVLCYFLSKNQYVDNYVKELEKQTGMSFIAIPDMGGYCHLSSKSVIRLNDVGPSEFLYLFRNAFYVLTDSFHGSVFAIQFKKPFLTFRRFFDESNMQNNFRIDNLFDIVGIDKDRIIKTPDIDVYEKLKAPIDWSSIRMNLGKEKEKSLQFLSGALA